MATSSISQSTIKKPIAVNTDGDAGGRIFVGTADPSTNLDPEVGDVWIETT